MDSIRSRFERARETLREDGTLTTVLRHASWLTGSSGALVVLSAIQGVLTARILGVANWGALGVALSFSAVVGRLLSFRMNEFVVKWVTQLHEDGSARAATVFKLALAGDVVSALVAFAIVESLAYWGASAFAKNPGLAWVFQLVALTIVFQAGREALIGMLHVNRDFRAQGLIQVASQTISVCGIGVAYFAGWGMRGVVGVVVGASAVMSVLMWTFGLRAAHAVFPEGWMRRQLVQLGETGREMARFAVLGNISGTLRSMMNDGDLLVLGFLRSPLEVGYYKLAQAICQLASLPMMPLVDASYPEFSLAAARGSWSGFRALMRRGSKVAVLWFLPASVALVAIAPSAIALLYGREFLPAVPAVAILLVGIAIDGVLFWAGITLLAMGEPGYLTAVNVLVTAVKYILAFLLVPVGGYLALAAVQSFVVAFMNALTTQRTLSGLRTRESIAHG